MPQTADDLVVPPDPRAASGNAYVQSVLPQLKLDVKAAEAAPIPARALSWNDYDQDLQSIVSGYNNYLRATPGYTALDWHLIKAMLLVETNPHGISNGAWQTKPMQSHNKGDSGWNALTSDQDRLSLIVPPAWRRAVSTPNASGIDNIAAGVGYLLYRAAQFGQKTATDDKTVKTATVNKGDSLYLIARHVGTTEEVLRKMNPSMAAHDLKPGTTLKYSPAKMVTVITGWAGIDPQATYRLYNGSKLGDYGDRVQFMYDLIKKNKILQ